MSAPLIGQFDLERTLKDLRKRLEILEGRQLIQSGNTVVTCNGSGVGTIAFAVPYTSAPIVIVSPYDVVFHVRQIVPTTSQFTFQAYDSANGLLASTMVRVGWLAFPATQ